MFTITFEEKNINFVEDPIKMQAFFEQVLLFQFHNNFSEAVILL